MKYVFDVDGTLGEFRVGASYGELFSKGYYYSIRPHLNVIEAAKCLAERGEDVYWCSAYYQKNQYAVSDKNKWGDKYCPFIPKEHRLFIPCGENKGDIIKEIGPAILIDDHTPNLKAFEEAGGIGVKLMNGVNFNGHTWTGSRISYMCDPEIMATLLQACAHGSKVYDATPMFSISSEEDEKDIDFSENQEFQYDGLFHSGCPYENAIWLDESKEIIAWMYLDYDADCGCQYIENVIGFDEVINFFMTAGEHSSDEFFEYLEKESCQYHYEINAESFVDANNHFSDNPDFTECSAETEKEISNFVMEHFKAKMFTA